VTVNWQQYGEVFISRCYGVSSKDPRTDKTAVKLGWIETRDGLVVPDAPGNTVWLQFVEPAYRYTATEWVQGTTYNRYDLVFYPGTESSTIFPNRGEVYEAELDTNGDYFWELVPFPAFLSMPVIFAEAADMLRHYGEKDKASEFEDRSSMALANEVDKIRAFRTVKVVVQ